MTNLRNQQVLQLVRQLRSLYRDLYHARPQECAPAEDVSLTRSQAELFAAVAKHEDGISATDLADILRVSSGAITQLVDPLVEKSLLTRRRNPQDGRGVLIALRQPLRKPPTFEEFYAGHISPMFDDLADEELTRLVELITKIKRL